MKRVMLTGTNGFTGRYLCPVLAAAGYEVHGLVHSPGPAVIGMSREYGCDLTDPDETFRVTSEIQPDLIVHLAGIANVGHPDIEQMYRTNIMGSRHLLDSLSRQKKTAEAVLVTSSANIYGNGASGIISEEQPVLPANDYGVTKVAKENLAHIYSDRLPIIVARPFNYTGIGQTENFIIPKIVAHFKQRESLIEMGNIDVARDFSDVRDVVSAYLKLLQSPAAIGQTINISSGEFTSISDLLDMARRLTGHDIAVSVNPALVRGDEVKWLCGSRARLDSVIDATPLISLEDTLRWMLEA